MEGGAVATLQLRFTFCFLVGYKLMGGLGGFKVLAGYKGMLLLMEHFPMFANY